MPELTQLLLVEGSDEDDAVWWVRTVETPLIPDTGSRVILWGSRRTWATKAPVSPVVSRMWLPNGGICVLLRELDEALVEKLGGAGKVHHILSEAGWVRAD